MKLEFYTKARTLYNSKIGSDKAISTQYRGGGDFYTSACIKAKSLFKTPFWIAQFCLLLVLLGLQSPKILAQQANLPCNSINSTPFIPPTIAGTLSQTTSTSGVGAVYWESSAGCFLGLPLGCGSTRIPANVINSSTTDFARVNLAVGLGLSATMRVTEATNTYSAGNFAGYLIDNASLVSAGLLSAITVKTYNNGTLVETSSAGSLIGVSSTLAAGKYEVGFYTTQAFDAIEITFNSVAGLAVTYDVYYPVVKRYCAGPALPCNTSAILSQPTYPLIATGGVSGLLCVGCSVGNLPNAIDASTTNYADMTLLVGAGTTAYLSIKDPITDYVANTFVGMDIENTAVLGLDLFSGITLTTYLNGVQQETKSGSGQLISAGSSLLGGTGRQTVGFITTLPFDEIKLSMASLVGISLGTTRVYGAIFEKFCAATIACNQTYSLTNPTYPVLIDGGLTGISGLVCVGCSVTNTGNVLTASATDYATMTVVAGLASSASIAVQDVLYTYPAGTALGFTIKDANSLLQADLFGGITVSTYNNGVLQETKTASQVLDLAVLTNWIGLGSGAYNVGFTATLPFDEVRLTVGSLLSALNVVQVYGAFVNTTTSYGGSLLCASTFNFNCAGATSTGTFTANGTGGQTGSLTIPLTGTTVGSSLFNVTGTGFTASYTATLTAGQTSVTIPITYNGSGSAGSRTLTVTSISGTGSCTPSVTVVPANGSACLTSVPLLLPLGQILSIPTFCVKGNYNYYKNNTSSTQDMLAINTNGNAFNPVDIIIDASTSAAHSVSNTFKTTALANRMISIQAPGTYTVNGGIRVRIYYTATELMSLPTATRRWFKHTAHTKAGVLADLTASGLANATFLTPDSTGFENGLSFVEFFNITNFSTFGFMGVSCSAGTTAPTLSGTTLSNTCPATTVDLNSLVTSTTPTDARLRWHTVATNPTVADSVATPSVLATAGTYYAYYFDELNNCYSPATAAVTVTINSAPAAPTTTVSQPTCSVATGTITVTAPSSGVTYSFDNGTTYQASNIKSGLAASTTYQIVVKDDISACVSTATPSVINAILPVPSAPTVTITQPTCSVTTGTIEVNTPSSGVTYSFDNGTTYQASNIKSGLAASTTYQVVVKDNTSACVSTATPSVINAILAVPSAPTTTITQPTCSVTTGTIEVNTPTSGVTYSFDDGANFQASATSSALVSGTYQVKVKDNTTNCISPATPSVINAALTVPSAPTATVTAQPTCATTTASVSLTGLPSTGTWTLTRLNTTTLATYVVTGTGSGSTFSYGNVPVGTYTYTVKDNATNCESTASNSITVNAATPPTISNVSKTDPSVSSCPSLNDGTITVTATGSNLQYSKDNGATWQASNQFTGLVAGSYTIKVKDNVSTCEVVYTSNPVVLTAVSCNTAPVFTSAATATTPENVSITTVVYTATATDANSGQTQTYSFETGGVDNAKFTIDPTTGEVKFIASPDFETPTDAGGNNVYEIKVKACDNGTPQMCATRDVAITVTDIAPECATVGGTATYSGGTVCSTSNIGTIILTGQTGNVTKWQTSTNGGTSWTDIAGTALKASYNFVNAVNNQQFRAMVNAGGGVCVDVPSTVVTITTSATACAASTCSYYSGNFNPTIVANSNPTYTTYAILVNPTTGLVSYVTAANSNAFTGVNVGNYVMYAVTYDNTGTPSPNLIVGTDISTLTNCVSVSDPLLTQVCACPTIAAPTVSITQPACGGTTGSITVTNPTTGVTYSFDNGTTFQASNTKSNLAAATTYQTLTKDNTNGCTSTATPSVLNAILTVPNAPTTTVTQPTCSVSTGTITVIAPSSGVTYSFDNGATYQASATSSALASGTYQVIVKDNTSACVSTATATVIDAPLSVPSAPTTTIAQPTCGATTGTITVTAPVLGVTYSFDNGATYQASATSNTLASGTYQVKVKDNTNGCISTATPSVIDAPLAVPAAPTVTMTQPTCSVTTGTITITSPSSGVTYSFDNGTTYQASATSNALIAGTYQVKVKDIAGGCVSTATPSVIDAPLTVPSAPTTTVSQPTCSVATGTITITSPSSGVTYSFDNGATFQASATSNALASGTYQVVVKDNANTCVSPATATVINAPLTVPSAPTTTVVSPTCGVTTGTITVTAPASSVTYSFDNGTTFQAAATSNALASGTYQVKVKDNVNSCVSAATPSVINAALIVPLTPTATVVQPNCATATGTITITSPPSGVTYSFDNGATYQVSATSNALASGTYAVKVKDNTSGCASPVLSMTINAQPSTPSLPTLSITQPTCTNATGGITITQPTDAGMTYSINGTTYTNTTGVFSSVASGTYPVTAKSASGCISPSASATINVIIPAPTVTIVQPTCTVSTGSFTVIDPVGAGFSYSVDLVDYSNTSGVFSNLSPTTYYVTAKNASNCVSAATPVVILPPVPTPIIATNQPNCTTTTGTITITTPTTGVTYSFDNGLTFQASNVLSNAAAGTYQIVIKNNSDACVTTPKDVVVHPAPSVGCSCNNATGTITSTISNQNTSPAYTQEYILTDNSGVIIQSATTPSFTGLTSNQYAIYAINYKTTEGVNGLTIGQNIAGVNSNCLDVSAPLFYTVCLPTYTCNSNSGNITATISGQNAAAGFTQSYALTNENGVILSLSTTPSFMSLANGKYQLFALNYETSGGVTGLSVGMSISSVIGACFNKSNPLLYQVCIVPEICNNRIDDDGDGLIDCEDVTDCPSCGCDNTTGDITFTNTGQATTDYTQVYVLTDSTGRILKTNTVATFTGLSSGRYRVYAINYRTADGITGITVGGNISGVTGLCFDKSLPLLFKVCLCVTMNIKVMLEGPYQMATSDMQTILNQRGLLPGQTPIGQFAVATPTGQPYNVAPWNYSGTEGATMTTYPATVVDWVLVTLRPDSTTTNNVFRVTGLLHNDGHISFLSPCFDIANGKYFVVIEHRNHVGVMSPNKAQITNGVLTHDFTVNDSYVFINPPSFGQKQKGSKWVMYAGDGKKDTQATNFDVNFQDNQYWKLQSGIFDQYKFGDFNMDADVNFSDNYLWKFNSGKYSAVPH